jgi:hypothetical protein
MYYAQKKFLVTVYRAEETGELLTMQGEIPVRPTDIIATDQFGTQFVMTDKYFYENHVPVRKIKKTKTPRKSQLEEYANAYIEMGELVKQSNENNENYIFDIKN